MTSSHPLIRICILAGLLGMQPSTASATAKLIHVPDILSQEAVPNPPADEESAAALPDAPNSLPAVIRLRPPPLVVEDPAPRSHPQAAIRFPPAE